MKNLKFEDIDLTEEKEKVENKQKLIYLSQNKIDFDEELGVYDCHCNTDIFHTKIHNKIQNKADKAIVFLTPYGLAVWNKELGQMVVNETISGLLRSAKINIEEYDLYFVYPCRSKYDVLNAELSKKYLKVLLDKINKIKDKYKYFIITGSELANYILGDVKNIKARRHQCFSHEILNTVYCTYAMDKANFTPKIMNTIVEDIEWIKNHFNGESNPIDDFQYIIADSSDKEVIGDCNLWGFDIETTGLNPKDIGFQVLTAAISNGHKTYGYNINHPLGLDIPKLEENNLLDLLKNKTLITHHGKFDHKCILSKFGFLPDYTRTKDTLIMSNLLNENKLDNTLKTLASEILYTHKYHEKLNVKNLKEEKIRDVLKYNCQDAFVTFKIYEVLSKEITNNNMDNLLDFYMQAMRTLTILENTGVKIDEDEILNQAFEFNKKVNEKEKELYLDIGYSINLNSSAQLRELIFNEFKIQPIDFSEKTGEPSTSKDTINKILLYQEMPDKHRKILNSIVEFNGLKKIYNDYFVNLPKLIDSDGRLRTQYQLTKYASLTDSKGTETGRLSSTNPNLQNIKRNEKGDNFSIRSLFIADTDHYFVEVDYNQLELVVATFLSRDPSFLSAIENGMDIHTYVCADILGNIDYEELNGIIKDDTHSKHKEMKAVRTVTKTINFGILYGIGLKLLHNQLVKAGVLWELSKVEAFSNKWKSSRKVLMDWIEKETNTIIETGKAVSLTGRTRHLTGTGYYDSQVNSRMIRQGVNSLIQTLASEICLMAINLIQEYIENNKLQDKIKIVLTVHDSICLEVHNSIEKVFIEKLLSIILDKYVRKYINLQFNRDFDLPLRSSVSFGLRWSMQ